MLPLTVRAVCLNLLSFAYLAESFVMLTANVEDIRQIAKKFLSQALSDQLSELMTKVKVTDALSEENDRNQQEHSREADDLTETYRFDKPDENFFDAQENAKYNAARKENQIIFKPHNEMAGDKHQLIIETKKSDKAKDKKDLKKKKAKLQMQPKNNPRKANPPNPKNNPKKVNPPAKSNPRKANPPHPKNNPKKVNPPHKNNPRKANPPHPKNNPKKVNPQAKNNPRKANPLPPKNNLKKVNPPQAKNNPRKVNPPQAVSTKIVMKPTLTTAKHLNNEFDQYDNTNYPRNDLVATSGQLALPRVDDFNKIETY